MRSGALRYGRADSQMATSNGTSGLRNRIVSLLARPIQRWHWAAAGDARRAEAWGDVASHLEALHRWYWEVDESHFLLASAYAQLGRWQDSVAEFEKIRAPLAAGDCEQQRHLTRAHCHYRLGEWQRVRDVLGRARVSDWSSPTYRVEAEGLLQAASTLLHFENEIWPAVQSARNAEDWEATIELLEPLHSERLGTYDTLLFAADAYWALGDWDACIEAVDAAGEPSEAPDPSVGTRLRWLRALALKELGRAREYEEIVSVLDPMDCPEDIRGPLGIPTFS